jgi:DNA-binding transcriptional LysR family regulator
MERKTYRSGVTLDQWLAIVAVSDEGGLHPAGRRIGRSHSAVAEAVHKAEEALGVTLFEVSGRSLRPTAAGQVLVHRARALLATADGLEQSARLLAAGWESEITLVVDGIVSTEWLAPRLQAFASLSRGTRLRLVHELKTGAARAAEDGAFDVVLTGTLPLGGQPRPVLDVVFVPVAAPSTAAEVAAGRDIGSVRQLVVADTADSADTSGWLRPTERWTVPTFDAAVALARRGLGMCVAPREWVAADLAAGTLIALTEEALVRLQVHLVLPKGAGTGPAAGALAAALG